jgi:hypothetical protein|tara:strand:+ start:702 stop:1031 length:330 start_codon:yes stop_codon:yes gene_type:complete
MISSIALQRLGFKSLTYHPDGDFRLHDDSQGAGPYIAEWRSGQPQPSTAEIEAAHAEWQAEYNAQAYARNRATAYPPIGDQLDALFHAGVFPSEMASTLQAVKDKYPKV